MSTCKKSHARMADAWEARNCRQIGDARRGQDPPDGSRADTVPEAKEFALDAPVTPARVLPGQPPDQLTDLLRDRRAPAVLGYVHLFLIRCRCQVSRVPGVTIRCSRRCRDSSRAKAAITARSAQCGFGRVTWRRRIATSGRSTKISASLEMSLRASSASQPNNRIMSR